MFNAALLLLALHARYHGVADAFTLLPRSAPSISTVRTTSIWRATSDLVDAAVETSMPPDSNEIDLEEPFSGPVRAPLKSIGPYIGLGLNFPDLATASQRSRNMTGIALDFVLDTAANINTLNGQVAQELDLEIVDEAPGGISASGPMAGGHTYLLGSCELEGLPKDEQFIFMENLTASALPVASPAAAGLLSLPFFHCFEGGVVFDWNGKMDVDDNGIEWRMPPSVTFYASTDDSAHIRQDMTPVSIQEIPVTRLPKVMLNINGVSIPALFDTGSPITVLNAQAAEKAGVKTINALGTNDKKEKSKNNSFNPFSGLVDKFQEAQTTAQAAARGDILAIAGAAGERVDLLKSDAMVDVSLPSFNNDNGDVEFGQRNVYVGNIPGLAALNGLGDDSPPAAVLGMDVLRSKKMLLVARNQEVYF